MIKTLYKEFQRWSEKGSVYLYSDPHFMDIDMNWRWELIKDYPYAVLDWLTEENIASYIAKYILYQINKVCTKNDTIIMLGDIGNVNWIKKISAGTKILITGNHDKGTSNYIRTYNEEVPSYDNHLFDEVYDGPVFIAKNILLSHEPITGPWVNYHGHVHDIDYPYYIFYNIFDDVFNRNYDWIGINCCCETNAFCPINLKKSIEEGGFAKINDIHRITIDKASLKKSSTLDKM